MRPRKISQRSFRNTYRQATIDTEQKLGRNDTAVYSIAGISSRWVISNERKTELCWNAELSRQAGRALAGLCSSGGSMTLRLVVIASIISTGGLFHLGYQITVWLTGLVSDPTPSTSSGHQPNRGSVPSIPQLVLLGALLVASVRVRLSLALVHHRIAPLHRCHPRSSRRTATPSLPRRSRRSHSYPAFNPSRSYSSPQLSSQ